MLGRRPTRRIVLTDTREPRPGGSRTHETCSDTILRVTSSGAATYINARGATSDYCTKRIKRMAVRRGALLALLVGTWSGAALAEGPELAHCPPRGPTPCHTSSRHPSG